MDAVERVRQLCDELARRASGEMAAVSRDVGSTVAEPLRVAVVGRVKAGKSTLVNALIGTKVAATNATECTRIVTWYRFGISAPTEVVLRDGSVHTLPVSGYVPEEIGVPVERVAHAVVYLQEQPLQELTLIDTPGLETSTERNEEATRRAILNAEAGAGADAIIYVFKRAEHGDDLRFVREFNNVVGAGVGASIGVLSSADLFGSGPWHAVDPIDAAAAFVADMARRHTAILGTIVPFSGRMAEASRTGEIREDDARTLARLADLDDLDLQDLEVEPFAVDGVDPAALARVVQSLRGYPLRHGRTIAGQGAAALARWMLERSGYATLEAELRSRYIGLSHHLKLRQGLARLHEAATRAPGSAELIDAIQTARIDPALHVLREFDAHELLLSRAPRSPLIATLKHLMLASTDRERLQLAATASDAEVYTEARRRASEEVAHAAVATDSAADNAHVVLAQSYRLLAARHDL